MSPGEVPALVLQPPESSLCGHCCVAMAAGVDLETARRAVVRQARRGSGSTVAELAAALRTLGVGCASRRVRARGVLPDRAIVTLRFPNVTRHYHWMLHWNGTILDPAGVWPNYQAGSKITSYLEVFPE